MAEKEAKIEQTTAEEAVEVKKKSPAKRTVKKADGKITVLNQIL